MKIEAMIFTVLLTLAFSMASLMKLTGSEMMAANFERWGYTVWFMYVVGTFELLGVIGLWVKKVRKWAALGFVGLMIAALATHIMHDPPTIMIAPGVLLLLAGKLVWIRKRQASLPDDADRRGREEKEKEKEGDIDKKPDQQ